METFLSTLEMFSIEKAKSKHKFINSNIQEQVVILVKESVFDNVIEQGPDQKKNACQARLLFTTAEKLMKAEDATGSLDFYNRSLTVCPPDAGLFYSILVKRSTCLARLGEVAGAAKDLERVHQLGVCPQERHFLLYQKLVDYYAQLGQTSQAKLAVERLYISLESSSLQEEQKDKITTEAQIRLASMHTQADTSYKRKTIQLKLPAGQENRLHDAASDGLEVVWDERQGRHAVAARDITPGEVIVLETPVTRCLLPAARPSHCSMCWTSPAACLPCQGCTHTIYCSLQCRAQDTLHSPLCGLTDLLDRLGEDAKLVLNLFLTFGEKEFLALPRERNPVLGATSSGLRYDSNSLLNAFTKFGVPPPDTEENKLTRLVTTTILLLVLAKAGLVALQEEHTLGRLAVVVDSLLASMPCNRHGVGEMVVAREEGGRFTGEVRPFGVGLYNTVSLLNHSCLPNIVRVNCEGSTLAAISSRAIRKGEELVDCYGVSRASGHSRQLRQETLEARFGFQCSCLVCQQGEGGHDQTASQHLGLLGKIWQESGNLVDRH